MSRRDEAEGDDAERLLAGVFSRSDYRPLTQRQLLHHANIPDDARAMARRALRRMLADGRLVKVAGGKLTPAERRAKVAGRLQRHREGFGFVVPDDGGEDVFVAPDEMGDALTGDRVEVKVGQRRGDGRVRGSDLKVIDPRDRETLGLIGARQRGGSVVQPFDPVLRDPIWIPDADRLDAQENDAVRIEILRAPTEGRQAEGRVLEIIGGIDDPGTDVAIVSHRYGLDLEFAEPVLKAGRALPSDPDEEQMKGRTRFDDPSPVTIDGETARDFDDAIAVRPLPGGGFRLWVHIADVAHVVTDGTVLDREARRRGTSVYFPDRALPMFPEQLSTELCSLKPGVNRLVQSAILDFDAQGKRTAVRYDDGVIRSAARLTYRQVAGWLGDEPATDPEPAPAIMQMLRDCDDLRDRLEKRRHARGSIDFDLPEPEILLDVEGVMTGISVRPRNIAHRMIEEFMLAANEAVAETLDRSETDALYRIHEQPDPRKLDVLGRFVERYGLTFDAEAEHVTPSMIQQLLDRVEGKPEARVVAQVALRTMQRARYSPENAGHFALAAEDYCHFTSPIRRYPDLVVHRALRAQRQGKRLESDEPLVGLGETCSELERNAEAAERELLTWKKVAFISEHVGESFDGVITGVTAFGVFVQLVENLCEGLVRIEALGDDWFDFDEGRVELLGRRTGQAIGLGDPIRITVVRVDRALLRADFVPEGTTPPEPRRSGPPRRGRGGKKRPDRSGRRPGR